MNKNHWFNSLFFGMNNCLVDPTGGIIQSEKGAGGLSQSISGQVHHDGNVCVQHEPAITVIILRLGQICT